MMPRLAVAVAFLGCSFAWSGEPPLKSDKPPIPGVEVELRFSVKELDPLKPDKSYLECIVRNKSAKAVKVPTVYTANWRDLDMLLWAKEYWPLTLRNWAGVEKDSVIKPLEPKEERVVFKKELKDLFLLEYDREPPLKPGEKRLYWSWTA